QAAEVLRTQPEVQGAVGRKYVGDGAEKTLSGGPNHHVIRASVQRASGPPDRDSCSQPFDSAEELADAVGRRARGAAPVDMLQDLECFLALGVERDRSLVSAAIRVSRHVSQSRTQFVEERLAGHPTVPY